MDDIAKDSLLRLPDEIIQSILNYLPPKETAHASKACRRLTKIANESLLWRYYCIAYFDYWREGESLFKHANVGKHDWRQLFVKRLKRDGRNMQTFEALLKTQYGRIERMEEIAESGYEAKELLLGYCNAPAEEEDVLARRFWAETTLGMIQRGQALQMWEMINIAGRELVRSREVQPHLQEYMHAFDLFILGSKKGDIDDVKKELQKVADEIREAHSDFEDLSLQERVEAIITHLRSRGLVGNPNPQHYHALRNNYHSIALFDETNHATLPLQSATLFISVCSRLNIYATYCNFPSHIYALVPINQSFEDLNDFTSSDFLVFDPWTQPHAVNLNLLQNQLSQMRVPTSHHASFIRPAVLRDIIARVARNIRTSLEQSRLGHLPSTSSIDTNSAFYSFIWNLLLLGDPSTTNNQDEIAAKRRMVPHLLQAWELHFPEDIGLVERYVPSILNPQGTMEFGAMMAQARAADRNIRPLIERTGECAKSVNFRIGQVFQHRRYGYVGVVTGWDAKCSAGEEWIARMDVDRLSRGRGQSFYHILAEDKSKRYVAEENISPLFGPPSEELLRLAGRYFKRWDEDRRMFVSNVRDEYPDD